MISCVNLDVLYCDKCRDAKFQIGFQNSSDNRVKEKFSADKSHNFINSKILNNEKSYMANFWAKNLKRKIIPITNNKARIPMNKIPRFFMIFVVPYPVYWNSGESLLFSSSLKPKILFIKPSVLIILKFTISLMNEK